ncbi:HAD-IA family hydrolase [Ideonella sp. 4Y16]|uniref:HAD-IA family hydrolase n=1 Tax=Ideonella alba TaxID=2824118 RepID=UPI001B39501D|nr:HAD-IA family hydrolase [Ideonella alba]MBQ0945337.1 HAD-IA family hydrolase [Ideonella alba]
MRYSVITFDLDGTMVDTADEIAEAANRTLAEFGVPRQDPAMITGFIGHGARHMMMRLMAHVLLEQPERADTLRPDAVLARLDAHYGATAGLTAKPYPGCRDALRTLREHGVRVACLTNKEHRYATKVLRSCGLADMLDYVVGGDLLPQKKPDPAGLHHVLGVLGGQTHRAAHVGDSRTDVETARAAGAEAWAVPWGYNSGEPIQLAHPDRVFNSLPEIAELVVEANRAWGYAPALS